MADSIDSRGPVDTQKRGTGFWTLGLSLRAPRSTWLAASALGVYLVASMARDLSLYDSGELALAAVQLGLAHPPGQPLHTLFGFALAHLPFLSPLAGVNLASALPAALTLVPAASLGQRLLGPRAAPAAISGMPWLLAACALHAHIWEPATRVEVYAFASFGAVWVLAAAAGVRDVGGPSLFAIGLALGLTASVNPMIAVITALAISPAIAERIWWELKSDGARAGRRALARVAGAVAGGVVGLLPYAYLPIAATRTDVMVWGGPHDSASYARYLTLRDYAHNQGISLALWLDHLADWLHSAAVSGLAPLIALGCIGHLVCGGPWTRRVSVPLAFLLALATIALNIVWNVEVPDYDGYLAAPLWALSAGALALGLRTYSPPARQLGMVVLSFLCVLSAILAPPAPWTRTRSSDRLARELGERVLREAPASAIVISESDAVTGALFYLQAAERARPDVSVLAYGLASSTWHWEQLWRAHPDLAQIALPDPGGRSRRVQRWLAANAARPVLVERLGLAQQVGLAACAGGLFLRAGPACRGELRQDPSVAPFIAERLAQLGDGSPSVAGLLAQTSYDLGDALWRLGDASAGHALLLAGVPASARPAHVLAEGFERAPYPPPLAAGIQYRRAAALGDPGRNLFLAAAIVSAAGKEQLARDYVRAAAATGLPEAVQLTRAE